MPTLVVDVSELHTRLGRTYTQKEFDELCFQFGIELDDVRDEASLEGKSRGGEVIAHNGGAAGASAVSHTHTPSAGSRTLYYIALPANRTDLLCVEGLTRALNVFLERMPSPEYRVLKPTSRISMTVKPSTKVIRPYVVAAVLRGVTFTPARYESFIDLQDKLHQNIARRRTLVAIGTHDLDTVVPPFTYEAKAPADINFVPLTQTRSFRADELMEYYRTNPTVKHIKPYVDIIADSPVYPVIYDSKQTVLSLPPIINGHHSRIDKERTRNVFIECTATDLAKAHVVLNTMVAMFSEYASEPFTIEEVQVVYEEPVRGVETGSYVTPQMEAQHLTVDVARLQSTVGVPIDAAHAAKLASRMQLSATVTEKDHQPHLSVTIPPTRADVLHEVDVIEDVAIAYGYNNIPRSLPRTVCTGLQQPVNKLTDQLRAEFAHAGYTETLTFALVSHEENFSQMLVPDDGKTAVVIANPQTVEFQEARCRLLPGILKSLASNKSVSIAHGVKLFEISDVVLLDDAVDVGARNERHAAALYCGPTAGFEVIHGLVDRLFQLLEVPHRPFAWETPAASAGAATASTYGRGGLRYFVDSDSATATYLPGRGARVVLEHVSGKQTVIGSLGVLHPTVLKNFDLGYPVSVMEVNIEPFLAA